jgi:hypothetical protein
MLSNSKPVSLIYPIVFFGGVLFLCAWAIHGNRLFASVPYLEHEIVADPGVK